MIEVVFSESTKGSIKVAKNYNKENMISGAAMGYIGGTPPSKKELEECFEGEALGGNSNEVIGISLSLDIGDISKGVTSGERKKILFKLLKTPFSNDEEEKSLEMQWQEKLNDLQMLKNLAQNGEHIRIWYSDAPYSICGFYFINSILENYNCSVSAIKLPKYEIKKKDTVVSYSSWGEINAGKFYKFLPLETNISKTEQRFFASRWKELQRENTLIRAVVNGELTSVNEDFYDYFIRINLPDTEFVVARLIGQVLATYQFGIGDWWIGQRIRNMIAKEELEIVLDNEFDYRKVLKKSNL